MTGNPAIRYRASADQRAELEALQQWVGAPSLSETLRRGIEALKRESHFDDRDSYDEEEPAGLPPFVPGAGLNPE